MIKAGIIGLGKMGISHAAIVGAHPDVDMVAVCDTSSFVLDGFKKFSEVHVYSDYVKMFEDEQLDFVVVSTPTRFHYPIVKLALEKGIHVFCEKPFSLTVKEGEELNLLAKSKGLISQVGYHNHFIGTFIELKRLLQTGILGELLTFSGEAYGPVVLKEKGGTWRSKPEEGGGCLFDYASHVINLIQELIARPIKIKGALLPSFYSNGVDDAVFALLELENGIGGQLSINWSDETYRKMSTSITIQGKKGKIICDATEIKIYLKEESKKENLEKGWTTRYITDFAIPVNFYLRGEEYSAQMDYFVDCILQRKKPGINSFEQALYTDKVVEMIIEASKN